MRYFLTGSAEPEWRGDVSDFLQERQIEYVDSLAYTAEYASVFKRLKILEGCDNVIACLPNDERQHLQTVLEVSYACKLAKPILIIDCLRRRKSWLHALPYSLNFSSVDALKTHLAKVMSTPKRATLLWG
jgi:nucleoside 2-deoxyribosyltransferase